ncbi:hypothetical protein SASPL_126686 [Salvia splendens]|uniref:Uncharacterized protein n=1 Tax=Salvia splendens TaxID=180675 RepID=A0A8X8XG35_SALSN|nr:hypothetical protein SASPL_126686 [Salvia splendens]
MPATKLCSRTLNAMKSEVGNDSLDTFIRQAVGKEPLLPFPRTVDSSVPWIQLFQALDQPGPRSPWLAIADPCESSDAKEWHKNRDLLAVFWDKLSLERAKELVSFNDIILKASSDSGEEETEKASSKATEGQGTILWVQQRFECLC